MNRRLRRAQRRRDDADQSAAAAVAAAAAVHVDVLASQVYSSSHRRFAQRALNVIKI